MPLPKDMIHTPRLMDFWVKVWCLARQPVLIDQSVAIEVIIP